MPRGNLETIHPRALVMSYLKRLLNKYVPSIFVYLYYLRESLIAAGSSNIYLFLSLVLISRSLSLPFECHPLNPVVFWASSWCFFPIFHCSFSCLVLLFIVSYLSIFSIMSSTTIFSLVPSLFSFFPSLAAQATVLLLFFYGNFLSIADYAYHCTSSFME